MKKENPDIFKTKDQIISDIEDVIKQLNSMISDEVLVKIINHTTKKIIFHLRLHLF
jgi:hypothetical protein